MVEVTSLSFFAVPQFAIFVGKKKTNQKQIELQYSKDNGREMKQENKTALKRDFGLTLPTKKKIDRKQF